MTARRSPSRESARANNHWLRRSGRATLTAPESDCAKRFDQGDSCALVQADSVSGASSDTVTRVRPVRDVCDSNGRGRQNSGWALARSTPRAMRSSCARAAIQHDLRRNLERNSRGTRHRRKRVARRFRWIGHRRCVASRASRPWFDRQLQHRHRLAVGDCDHDRRRRRRRRGVRGVRGRERRARSGTASTRLLANRATALRFRRA